jgi:hypothetical protein
MNCALALHQHCAQQRAAHTRTPRDPQILFGEEQDVLYQKPLAQPQYALLRRNRRGVAFPAHVRNHKASRKHFDISTGKNRGDKKGEIMKCHDCGSDSHLSYEKLCKIEDVMRHHYVRSRNGERLSDIYFEHLERHYAPDEPEDAALDDDCSDEDTLHLSPCEDENRTFLSLIEQRYGHAISGAVSNAVSRGSH